MSGIFKVFRSRRTITHPPVVANGKTISRSSRAIGALLGLLLFVPVNSVLAATCSDDPSTLNVVSHDLSGSYCELCGSGPIRIVLTNEADQPLTNVTVVENLRSSGLEYVPGTTTINGVATGDPVITGGSNQILTWTSTEISQLASLAARINPTTPRTYVIEFQVRRPSGTEEGLASTTLDRSIQASASFDYAECPPNPLPNPPWPRTTDTTGLDVLPLREPVPTITKLGRNVDAAQTGYTATVYGNTDDDVIWQVTVANAGLADMQDVIFRDIMTQNSGQNHLTYACPTQAAAEQIAITNNGSGPGTMGCVAIVNNTIDPFAKNNFFGNPNAVDVTAGGNASVYLVGKILGSCTNQTNTADNLQWGCQTGSIPDGGITQTSNGVTPAGSSINLSTVVNSGGLTITRQFRGSDLGPNVGTKGTITITITNNSGGTIKNLDLDDVLPSTHYVADPTYTPTLTVTHQGAVGNGNYLGIIDTVNWTNQDTGNLLNNGSPHFLLESSTTHPDAGSNLLRNGDVLTLNFRIVLINSNFYDKQANLDEPNEAAGVDDPAAIGPLANQLTVNYDEFCSGAATPLVFNDNFTPSPEDIDVSLDAPIYILTNDPTQLLSMTVTLTNRGGHSAADHYSYVSFGETIEVVNAPGACTRVSYLQTPTNLPRPLWDLPAPVPDRATVYECTSGVIGRNGGTRNYTFQVRKVTDTDPEYTARIDADDLTFRADVIGEIHLSDGTALTTPPPSDTIGSTVNNYTLDGIRARVIGYNLTKSEVGNCSENVAAALSPDTNVQIGEECTYQVRTGGWFGFKTPGFTYIAVQNIQVNDNLPNGQGYISSTDPSLTSDMANHSAVPEVTGVEGIALNPAGLAAPDEGTVYWTFNQVTPAERIKEKDKWFQANITTRLLNDPVDTRASPNVHAATSSNILDSTFEAVFNNASTGLDEIYTITPSTVGYPQISVRRVDLTVTEPNIQVTKEVCNETLHGIGPGCSTWETLTQDGDTNDSYIYRITLTNTQPGSVPAAPAYDVTTNDTLDSSDMMKVVDLNSDGIDNDGDGMIDGADTDGEGKIGDNTLENGTPATVVFSHTYSSALKKINEGVANQVRLYYRVDPGDMIAPEQELTNTVTASYDSLEGDYGNMSAPLRANGDIAGARQYTSSAAQATVKIIPVLTQPKQITATSSTTLGGPPQALSIGEEVRYELTTEIPVSELRNLVIRDVLPAGMTCVEAPAIDLSPFGPHASAGFRDGNGNPIVTPVIPTCTSTGTNDYVEWNFGNVSITTATGTRYSLPVTFIARVLNISSNSDGVSLNNGAAPSTATVSYEDEAGVSHSGSYASVGATVREPHITLTKSFSAASADAGDVLTVTVTAINDGNATAYNLRVLDNLVGTKMTFLNSVSGTDPPDNIDTTTLGANQPIFSWNSFNPDYAIAPGETKSFTFTVSVDANVEPGEILSNTIQASWQSLRDQSTSLNSSGLIGIDGSAMGMRNGSLPIITGDVNDYESTATATIPVQTATINKLRISDTYDATPNVRIGDTVTYELRLNLPEATISNVVLNDTLPQGLRFERVVSVNGDTTSPYSSVAPFTYTDIGAPTVTGDPTTGPTTVNWNLGQIVNAGDNNSSNNTFVIRYEAIVLSGVLPQANNTPLTNTVTLDYTLGGTPVPQQSDSETINVIQPDLVMTKTGPAGVQFGYTSTFTLNLQNTGTSTAWDTTVTDRLPNLDPAAGGMCDTPPSGFTAGIYTSGGTPVTTLTQGTDYDVNWSPAPTCELTFTMKSTAAAIASTQRLIITYQAMPDNDNAGGVSLTNVAGATEWFSQDTAGTGATGQIETYTRSLTNGTPTITDHEDAHTVVTEIPALNFEKTVSNVTTSGSGSSASPGDQLHYTITVTNGSSFDLAAFRLTDEVDRLSGGNAYFEPNSLSNIVVTGGGTPDTSGSDPAGGSQGTGLLDVQNLTLAAGASVTIEFDIRLASSIPNGTVVQNQAQILIPNYVTLDSDNPATATADDPTPTTISSAPLLQVEKVSQDLTGDPAILDAGDTLRYTITVKNIGNEDMNNVSLRDQIPANTTYVANSTTLNGAAVADPSAGVSALESGMSINAPENTTAGYMRADATATTSNVATITFDVVVNSSAVNGTVISNQGFVNGDGIGSGAFPETPSDDPGTATANDPTVDIVGSLPLIDAQKTVALTNDADGNLQVSSGDTLTYTITISNNGAVDATGVVFTDTMPTNVTYVAGSGRLNGATTGINFSGTTLTADYAGAIGNFARGTTATITFDVTVNGTVSNGDIISNQGTVSSNEQADEPTDADGNDANGDQPTLISVGAGQALSINKSVAVVGGGVALAGGQLEYTVQVANIGTTTATSVVIRDNMVAGQFAYVPGSGTLNGSTTGVSYVPTTLTANVGSLAAGASATLRFRVTLDSSLVTGTTVTNTGFVDWDTPTQTNNASVSIDIGGIPGFANLNGSVWHDANFDNTQDAGERPLQNWSVDIYRNSTLLDTVTTDANGAYQINGLAPNAGTADSYSLQFRAPGSTPTSAKLGLADSAFTNGLQSITDIIVGSGSNAQNLNLPIDPDGVIYDSVARTPIAGATVTMQEAGTGTPLPTSCFDDPNQQNQVTLADGYYKFDLNTTCAGSGDYLISVAPPASGYTGTESLVIPASSNATTAAYSVPVCAAASPSGFCTAQTQETAPSVSDATTYYLHVAVNTTTVPNNSQLFNNHIPLDPIITGTGVTLTKTAGKVNVMRGDLVPYTIVATNNLVGALSNNDIIDTMPPGFKYVAGSAKLNNVATEPTVNGRELRWSGVALNPGTPVTIKLLLIVGGGVGEGEYVNQAVVYNNILATNASSVATATVRVVPDPMTDCSDVIGRVFDDRNGNGYQDAGEPGVAGARVATVNGLLTTTDKHGRYHIACAAVPSRERGSNFILKLDTHSLPSGYRVTTENPRVQRLTRGQMAKINFGVALQRVVRLDLSNAAFKPVRDELRPEWLQSIDQVIDQLKEGPSVLRISYLGDAETASMVNARIKNVRSMIGDKWKALNPKYDLAVETEVFWRRGNPGSGGGGTPSKDGIAFSKLNGSAYYSDIGENTESLLPDAELTVWARDKSFHLDDNDPVYFKTRTIEQVENSNEQNLPSVSTDGGEPMVSKESITRVRQIIQRAGSDKRVRLQFIGYTDDRPLSDAEKKEYGDSITMSVEQARMVAEYYRRELNLNANQVSVEGRGASKPLNKRGLSNRRVDVRLFVEQVNQQQVEEPLVVPRPGTKELRVCRVESACITVRKKKDARKIVVNNLIEPIRFTQESDRVAPEVLAKLKAAFARYSDKPDIQLHFTGHVDSGGLNAEAVDRYGDKQGLSLALARVVADQVRDALGLRRDQVTYEGKGDKDAIAVNSTARGRALNRRIDVTLWYDAPQDILSISDPQVCPVDGGPGMISERYLPDGQNPVTPVQYQNGKPVINDADVKQLQSLLTQLADKPNLHIVFAGYTDKSLLNRRGAMAYGDNWGLAEARAKQVKTLLQSKLDLPASKMSYEGKGFADNVAADQGEVLASVDGYVDIEVWFDVPAPVDENVVAELRHIEQKTDPVNPFTLAPLRITVDGKRLDASLPNTADVQRCTDVALAKTKIKLNYDDSTVEPRLNVSASSASIAREDKPGTDEVENRVRFQGYTNYPAMIKKAEVRLFRLSQAPGDTPLAVVPLNDQWQGSWQAGQNTPDELKYVLRVYGKNNQYDETRSKRLHVVLAADALPAASDTELMSRAYGENTLVRQEIPLRGGTITVKADEVPPGHQVWIMNQRAPMDSKGNLVTQQIIPKGLHTVEVAVLDDGGNGQVYLRDLDLDSRDWFYTGIADVTAGMDLTTGQAATVTGDTTHFNNSMFTDGRLAFYVKGSTKKDLEVTASMDTKEGSLDSLFTDIAKRDPQTLFRRLDSDYENYVYPTFGDDSKTREDAPTQGKIYVKLKKNNNFAMWGNFKAEWLDTDLARIDRGLYGAYGHYESAGATSFGARQTRLDSYVAQPGTVRAREEFRGTGGSLYYLRQRDITQGAESVWVEVRDSVSGIVLKTNRLVAGQDYTIDPLQGRIQLTQPLSSTADDSQLIKAGSLSGYPVFLVVHYEYIPDLNQVDNSSVALRGSHWLGDKVKLGFTYSDDQQVGAAQTLGAVDITLRKTAGTYVKLESAQSTGPGTGEYQSTDGGYFFSQVPQDTSANVSAAANRVETSVDLKDFMKETRGKFNTYFQQVEGGFSGQGQLAATDTTQYGANLNLPFGDTSDFNIKLDTKEVDMGLHTSVASVDYGHKLNKNWKLTTGIRNDYRDDQSLVVPTTQTEGTRTDGAVRMTYESEEGWKAFGYAQATLAKDGTRDGNNRLGTGGEYQVSKRLRLYGEISNGDLGLGAKAGANYMLNDDTNLYSTYALDNERDVSGLRTTKGNFVNGFRSKTSDSMSIYGEERYTYGDVPTGLTHAYGVDLTPNKEWRFGAKIEIGDLRDPTTDATIDRTALGLTTGLTNDSIKYVGGFEYRLDNGSTSSRTTYVLKNKATYQTSDNWRLFGKLNLSDSTSSMGAYYDGRFVESVLGYAYRPVDNDRWNTILKYSYLYNVPATDQVVGTGGSANYLQNSHVFAVDTQYDLTRQWTIGAKLAYRLGQLSIDRVNPQFFDSRAQFVALRTDWHVIRNWDLLMEGRIRQEIDAGDIYTGALVGMYRHVGSNLKVGAGYNFSNFSDDLTNMDFNSQGLFINVIGKF